MQIIDAVVQCSKEITVFNLSDNAFIGNENFTLIRNETARINKTSKSLQAFNAKFKTSFVHLQTLYVNQRAK